MFKIPDVENEILRDFVNTKIGISVSGRNMHEPCVKRLIEIFKENLFVLPSTDEVKGVAEYIEETLSEWEILIFESFYGFNAYRRSSAEDFRETHQVYTVEDFVQLYDANDEKIEEDELMNVFEGVD